MWLAAWRIRDIFPVSYGRLYVLPLLSGFSEAYPDITLDLSFDDAYVDMIEHGVDVSIRSGTLDDSCLVAKQLSPIDFLICASMDYSERHGPITRHNLMQHPWIRFRFKQTGRPMPIMMRDGQAQVNLDPGNQNIVDDGEALADLCAQGLGLTQMSHFITRDWIRQKKIRPVFLYFRPKGFGVWVIYAKRDYLPARIKAFVGFLERAIQDIGESAYHTWAEHLTID
ncbi:MAG: substrate binding domain-containing protein [Ketobacteraceae bacterium]|nr:substrate binding domain-containing protein [Ketobacteraceae bacterium]